MENTWRAHGFRGIGGGVGDGVHAHSVRNMYVVQNALHKRHGYHQTVQFDGPINGVFDVRVGQGDYVLVYAGTRFYLRGADEEDVLDNYTDITQTATHAEVDVERLVSRRIRVFQQQDRVFVVGCGDYLVLVQLDGVVQLQRVQDNDITFVPTTTVGIGCSEDTYVPAVVTQDSVGTFYYLADGEYRQVLLDGENSLPQSGVSYYRRIASYPQGCALHNPNLLSSYRINTLYGCDRASSSYRLDAASIDADSQTVVDVTVTEEGEVRHYRLTPSSTGNSLRAPIVGDNLGGKAVTLYATTYTEGPLRVSASTNGVYEMMAEGGYMRWHAAGTSVSDWNHAYLVLHTSQYNQTVATATRSSWLYPYTVVWQAQQLTLPDDFGVVNSVGSHIDESTWLSPLPVLTSTLRCNGVDWGSVDYRSGTITFARATTPPDSQDNIVVRYKHAHHTDASRVCDATVGALFGVAGAADRLFVGGAEGYDGTDCYSQSDDWTYFSEQNVTKLADSGQVYAYIRVSDTLVTLLCHGDGPNAFWRSGTWIDETHTVGDNVYTVQNGVFAVTQAATLPTPATRYGACVLESDLLYLAQDGLYRLASGAYTDECKTRRLSSTVDNVQWNQNAVALAFDKRYYVSTGTEVYVADSRYRVHLDNESNYEWFMWAIGGVRVWFCHDRQLGFGTEDGRVCVFDEGWQDVTFEDTTVGQMSVNVASDAVTVDGALSLAEEDCLVFNQDVYYHAVQNYDASGAKIYVDSDQILHVYEGEIVYAWDGVTLSEAMYVAKVDWGNCTFVLQQNGVDVVWQTAPQALVGSMRLRPMRCTAPEDGAVRLCLKGDPRPVSLWLAPATPTARIVHTAGVCAEYQSEPVCMNAPDVTKVVTGVTVECDASLQGDATFSVRTSGRQQSEKTPGLRVLDYRWVDLNAFAFDGDFRRSYSVKMKMRFEYLQWKIRSSSCGDLVLRGVCVRYRALQTAKGVSN